jgi:hypothetical protein
MSNSLDSRNGFNRAYTVLLFLLIGAAASSQGGAPGIAGNSVVGGAEYPDGGIRLGDFIELRGEGENVVRFLLHDQSRRAAYACMNSSPGKIVKIDLDTLERVSAIDLNPGEGYPASGVLSPDGAFAYFGTNTDPGRVVKVDLQTFQRVDGISFEAGENRLTSAAISSDGVSLFFGTNTRPGIVVRVATDPFSRVEALALESDDHELTCAVVDPLRNAAYFAARPQESRVVRIDLSTFTRTGAIEIPGSGYISSGVLDPSSRAAFFCLTGRSLAKVDLETQSFTGSASLQMAGGAPQSVAADFASGIGYVANNSAPARVARVDLAAMSMTGSIVLGSGENDVSSCIFDSPAQSLFVGTRTSPGRIPRVSIDPFARADALILTPADSTLACAVPSPPAPFVYFGASGVPGVVLKLDVEEMMIVDRMPLRGGEDDASVALVDSAGEFAYFGTNGSPRKVVKIRLADFARVGAIDLPLTDSFLTCGALDSDRGEAYFGTYEWPAQVVKVDLASFQRVGRIEFSFNERFLSHAFVEPGGEHAYFCADSTTNPSVVRVDLESFARLDSALLPTGPGMILGAALDEANRALLVCVAGTPARVLKLDLGEFAWTGSTELAAGELFTGLATVSPLDGDFYVGAYGVARRLIRFDALSLERVGALDLPAEWPTPAIPAGWSKDGLVAGGRTTLGVAAALRLRMNQGQIGLLKGTRFTIAEEVDARSVRAYSHLDRGSYRFALYDDAEPKQLLWQSDAAPVESIGYFPSVQIADGAPASLTLAPGAYWLAWQVDTTASVPSYAEGELGDGFLFAQPFGPAPATLSSTQITATNERWTEHIVYNLGLSDGTALILR